MPRITTFLAYDDQAEEAAKFYVSVFKNSRIRSVTRYGEAGPGPKGSVMTVAFELVAFLGSPAGFWAQAGIGSKATGGNVWSPTGRECLARFASPVSELCMPDGAK